MSARFYFLKKMRIKDLKKKYTNSKPVPIAPEVFLSIRDTKKLSKILGIDYGRLLFHLGLLNKKPERGRYKEFTIAKKSGGVRNVSAPNRTILFVQRQLAEVLAKIYKPPKAAHGFINLAVSADGSPDIRKTIVSNAKQHKKKAVILNIDLKDFFPSINSRRVYSIFRKQPFNFDKKIAAFITEICIHDKNRNLPQGAATSPIISNMVCHRLDKRLTLLASDNRITYTRYADDLTFSTNKPGFNDDLLKTIYQIITEEGFAVNEKKVRTQTNRERQEVPNLFD